MPDLHHKLHLCRGNLHLSKVDVAPLPCAKKMYFSKAHLAPATNASCTCEDVSCTSRGATSTCVLLVKAWESCFLFRGRGRGTHISPNSNLLLLELGVSRRPLTLILLQKYRDTNGRRIVIQIGGVYITFC